MSLSHSERSWDANISYQCLGLSLVMAVYERYKVVAIEASITELASRMGSVRVGESLGTSNSILRNPPEPGRDGWQAVQPLSMFLLESNSIAD